MLLRAILIVSFGGLCDAMSSFIYARDYYSELCYHRGDGDGHLCLDVTDNKEREAVRTQLFRKDSTDSRTDSNMTDDEEQSTSLEITDWASVVYKDYFSNNMTSIVSRPRNHTSSCTKEEQQSLRSLRIADDTLKIDQSNASINAVIGGDVQNTSDHEKSWEKRERLIKAIPAALKSIS